MNKVNTHLVGTITTIEDKREINPSSKVILETSSLMTISRILQANLDAIQKELDGGGRYNNWRAGENGRENSSASANKNSRPSTSGDNSARQSQTNAPRPQDVTPSSREEAQEIASSMGDAYRFLAEGNIWRDLGAYQNQVTTGCCYCCLSSTHFSNDCLVNAVLILNNEMLRKLPDGSYKVVKRTRDPNPDRVKRFRDKWQTFLKGDNALGIQLTSMADINRYLTSRGSVPIEERRRLADKYYQERPKMSNTTRNRREKEKQNTKKSFQPQMTAFAADFVPLAQQGGMSVPWDPWSDDDLQQGYSQALKA